MCQDLPRRATPEGLHKICATLLGKELTIEEISDEHPQDLNYIQENAQYGVELKFISKNDTDYSLTKRGTKLAYEDSISDSVNILFFNGIRDSDAYFSLIEDINETIRSAESTVELSDVGRLLRISHNVDAPEPDIQEIITCLFKTMDAAGLGEFKLGRGTNNTRIELLNDTSLRSIIEDTDQPPSLQSNREQTTLQAFEEFDEELASECVPQFHRGFYQQAVNFAFVILEDRVREKGAFDSSDYGSSMMIDAFRSGDGPLRMGETDGEETGFQLMYQGVFKALRNPKHHRLDNMDRQQAHDILSFVNFLITLIENQD